MIVALRQKVDSGSRSIRLKRTACRAAAAAAVTAAVAAFPVIAASPAFAAVSGCSHGYVNANKAWGTCTRGSGRWSLTVQCFAWGANTAHGNGPGTIYATCPGWSHVTKIILNAEQ
jgi:hypothetical protein